MHRVADGLIALVIIGVLVFIAGGCFGGAFVSDDVAIKALRTQGYSNIKIVEKNWFLPGLTGCDSRDAVQFKVKAKNPVGNNVEVLVCSGWLFKGATIRTK